MCVWICICKSRNVLEQWQSQGCAVIQHCVCVYVRGCMHLCVCVCVILREDALKPIQALLSSLWRQEGWRLPKMTYSGPQRHYLTTQTALTHKHIHTHSLDFDTSRLNPEWTTLRSLRLLLCLGKDNKLASFSLTFNVRPYIMQISIKETQIELHRQIILTSNVKHKDVHLMFRTNHQLFPLWYVSAVYTWYSTAFSLHQSTIHYTMIIPSMIICDK